MQLHSKCRICIGDCRAGVRRNLIRTDRQSRRDQRAILCIHWGSISVKWALPRNIRSPGHTGGPPLRPRGHCRCHNRLNRRLSRHKCKTGWHRIYRQCQGSIRPRNRSALCKGYRISEHKGCGNGKQATGC